MNDAPSIDRFIAHLMVTAYEGAIKLENKDISYVSIYYDFGLVNYLLDSYFKTNDEIVTFLTKALIQTNQTLQDACNGMISVVLEKGRLKFTISNMSIEYIYTNYVKNDFIKDIIRMVGSHHFNIDDIKHIFDSYSGNYICEPCNNPEFDYVLYFVDDTINPYKFCFKLDECGGYYHRLLDYDYQLLNKA